MKIEKAKISTLKLNPANPRTIKDEKFAQLVRSVRDFPEMLEILNTVFNTIDTASKHKKYHGAQFRKFSKDEYIQFGTYPIDYNFKSIEPKYLIGMSVPPVMTAQIGHQIWLQWLSKTVAKQ